MTKYTFRRGVKFRLEGIDYQVLQRRSGDRVEIETLESQIPSISLERDLLTSYCNGHLVFWEDGSWSHKGDINTWPSEIDLDSYSPHLQQVAYYRKQIIDQFIDLSPTERSKAVRDYVKNRRLETVEQLTSENGRRTLNYSFSIASIKRWIHSYEKSGRDIRSLIPATAQRGGKNVKRLPKEVDQIIQEAVTDIYLIEEAATACDVMYEVQLRINEINISRSGNERLRIPGLSTIHRRINDIDRRKLDDVKIGKWQSRKKHKQYAKMIIPEWPLERVEIDHSPLDLIIGPTKTRCFLTIAIDCATKIILGFSISFNPPSYASILECLYHSIRPKRVPAEYELQNEYLGYGIPVELYTDGGKDFVSKHLRDACESLGITLIQLPPGTPEAKGTVERVIRTIQDEVHKWPGTTFSNLKRRGDYDSVAKARLDLKEVHLALTRLIVDVYSQKSHRGLNGRTPAQEWKTKTKVFNPRLPIGEKELRIILGHVERRKLHHYGIELGNLRYNCDELGPLRDQLNKGEDVKVKIHPGDVSRVYVFDPFKMQYIEAPVQDDRNGDLINMSLWEYQLISNLQREAQYDEDPLSVARAKRKLRQETRGSKNRRIARLDKVAESLSTDTRSASLNDDINDQPMTNTSVATNETAMLDEIDWSEWDIAYRPMRNREGNA